MQEIEDLNQFFSMSKQEENVSNRRGIVYYRLKESTFGKIYISLYDTWKEKQFSLNCHVLNDFKKINSQTDTGYTKKLL